MPIVVSSSPGPAQPGSWAALKRDVADIVGGSGQSSVLSRAETCLRRRIMEFNTKLWEFNKYTNARITTVSGTATYALNTQFYKELECHEMDAATGGNKVREISYIDFGEYEQVNTTRPVTSRPSYYTLYNQHQTGNVTFLPTPDAVYYFELTYYQRIDIPDADTDIIAAPQELERPLVLLAQADLLGLMAPESPERDRRQRDGQAAFDSFIGIVDRHPDQHKRFRLAPLSQRRLGRQDIYIRIT